MAESVQRTACGCRSINKRITEEASMIFYLNGQYVPRESAMIPVEDRAFLFGDGIYEGVRALGGKMFEWAAHAERMVNGLNGLRINFDAAQVNALEGVCERVVNENGLADGEAFLYLEVSRGAAPRAQLSAHRHAADGLRLGGPARRAAKDARRGRGGDHLSRHALEAARLEDGEPPRQRAGPPGSLRSGRLRSHPPRGRIVTEGAATNVFAVFDGVLCTHPLTQRILPGITRKVVMELLGELQLPVKEEPIAFARLAAAEEIFICGSTTDVTPVVTLDGKPVGNGKPGPLTVKVREAFEARLYQAAGTAR